MPTHGLLGESDKIDHALAFMVVALLGRLNWPAANAGVYWGICFICAALLEYLQGRWLPLRTYDIQDVYANLAGVLGALLICLVAVCLRRWCASQSCHGPDV